MSNKLFNKSISIFLTMIFIIGLFPSVAFAQPLPSSQYGEVKGFNRSVLDSHFSKADREINPERWLAEAKLGLTQAINAWELIANNLYENPDLFEEAKTALEKWSNEELEKRFSQWLNSRFFGEAAEKILLDFSQAFGETHKNYSWHLDADGNIIFDVKTGNPLIIRPNEEGREFSHDLLLWRDDAESHVNNVMIRLFPELLAYIPEELRETMASIINQTAMSKSNAIKMEFENIAAREERIFTSRRTRDLWSLRNKSENEAARIFTERLIAETDEVCKAGIEALNSRIEQAEAGASDLAIMGEEWLRLYKEQFERGLKAWEEAEERFFIRRIEWEQESFKLFSEGEETWLSAFNQLEEERQKWELKAKELFQAGEIMFKNISDDFNKSIADARKEFELNMSMRIGEGTTRVKALIDMYLICASAALSSMENVNFWFNQYDVPNKVNPKDLNFSVWLDNEQKKGSNNLLIEMKKSHDMYSSYIEKALDARDRILEDYAELLGTGALKDILSPEASSEDFFLDEYQIALIRAKALVLYWERKTEIAEAVTVYATELTAGRMTEAEGLRAWEEAKAAYNDSLFAYEAELKKLNEFGEDIKEQQEKLYLLTQNLQKEEEKLNRLNKDYTILISNSVISQSNYYLLDFKAKYIDLKDEYKKFQKTGTDANYKATLEYGMLWGIAEQKEAEKKYLNMLENIEDLSEEEIEFLQLAYNSITSFNQEENIQAVRLSLNTLFGNYGINQGNNFLPNIQNIIQAITAKPGDIESNMFQFINEFNECLSMIPFWLELEINNWVTSIVQYINIYTQNFTENEKHWRQYLSGELINDNDPEFVLVSSVKEGKLADALFIATYYTNRVNDSFAMFSNINRYNVTENTSLYFLLYYDGFSGIEFNINTLEYQYNEIINKARAYELSKLSTEDSIRQLSILEQSINLQNAVYNSLINEYYFEADKFINLGSVYDRQYNVLKKAHKTATKNVLNMKNKMPYKDGQVLLI
ncbi:MAG: hypothetical protein FWD13_01310 [Treponema sp.]|nr:hypothetical protein [Treponema sp.]